MNILLFLLAFAILGIVSVGRSNSMPVLKSNTGIPQLGHNPFARQSGPELGNNGVRRGLDISGVRTLNIMGGSGSGGCSGGSEVSEIRRTLTGGGVCGLTPADAANIPMHASILVREIPLLETEATYEFKWRNKSVDKKVKSECLLEENEAFVVTGFRLSVVKQTGTDHTTANYDLSQVNCRQDFTYADRTYFSWEDGDGNKEAVALEALWNTNLKVEVNGNVTIPKLPTSMMRYQPATRYTVTEEKVIGSVATDGTITYVPKMVPQFPETYCLESFCKLAKGQRFIMDGGEDTSITLNLLEGAKKAIVGMYDECGIQTFNKARLSLCGYYINKNKSISEVCSNNITF